MPSPRWSRPLHLWHKATDRGPFLSELSVLSNDGSGHGHRCRSHPPGVCVVDGETITWREDPFRTVDS